MSHREGYAIFIQNYEKGAQKDSLLDEGCFTDDNLDFYLLYGNCLVTIHEDKKEQPSMVMILRYPGGRAAWHLENRLGADDKVFLMYNGDFKYSCGPIVVR